MTDNIARALALKAQNQAQAAKDTSLGVTEAVPGSLLAISQVDEAGKPTSYASSKLFTTTELTFKLSNETIVDLLDGTHSIGDIICLGETTNSSLLVFANSAIQGSAAQFALKIQTDTVLMNNNYSSYIEFPYDLPCKKIDELNVRFTTTIRGTDMFYLYIIADTQKLNDENKTKFSKAGVYVEYIGISSDVSKYYKIYPPIFLRRNKIDSRYIASDIERTKNKVSTIAPEADDTEVETYPAVKAVRNYVKSSIETISPDDSTIDGKPWSSKQIIDTLCPPLEETGNPVQCYPVAGYPLGCKVSWEPTQAGSGEPSLDNIRSIVGRTSVQVSRSEDELIIPLTFDETIYGGGLDAVTGSGQGTWKLLTLDGTEKWDVDGKYLDDKSDWYYVSGKIAGAINVPPLKGNDICSHYPHADIANSNTVKGCAIAWGAIRVRWGDTIPDNADTWKTYLAAQYAAGTPVQVAYKLATPTSFEATGGHPIEALHGVNTVLTDADSVTVTGRADPVKVITDLQTKIDALTNTK